MKRDLVADTRALRDAIDGNSNLLAGLHDTLQLLSAPRNDDAWRRTLYVNSVKHTYWFVSVEFSRVTMAQLQYSGDMRLITDAQVREAMIAYEQGLETAQQQSRDVLTYFHELEESNKRLFDLTLSKKAIEVDCLNMLQPIAVFESLVPTGNYFTTDDPSLIADYYDDMLYHRTALNILTLMYRRQLQSVESLIALIETQYNLDGQQKIQ